AVIGYEVPLRLLRVIAGADEAALREGLTRLQAAELLYETRLYPDVEYTFKHALTHDVAYGSLLREQRRALHAALVGALETRAGRLDRLAPIFDEVQTLARRHGEQERLDAVAAFLTQFYWASGDYAKSIEYGERCLAMADARDDLGLRVSAHFYIGHAWASSGRLPEARAQYARVYALLGERETER